MAGPETTAAVDGRSARRDRNRQAVLDALIELFAEDVEPSPEEVAARCGVSPRSVYRYFEDRQGLMRAAMARHRELVYPLFVIESIGEGPFAERLARFVESRVRLYERVAGTQRAARHRAARDPMIRAQLDETIEALRDQVARHFAAELAGFEGSERQARLDAADALCQLEAIDYLGHHLGRDHEAIVASLAGALGVILAARP